MSATTIYVSLAGVDVTSRTRLGSLGVHETLGPAANKAAITFDDTKPDDGLPIKIGVGSLNDEDLIFAGQVLTVDDAYEQVAEQNLFIWPVDLIDHVYRLNRRRPFGTWTNISATTIAESLITDYAAADEFTADIEAALPAVSIAFDGTEDFMTCLHRLASAVGGRATVEYDRRVRVFITDTEDSPDEINTDNPPLNDPPCTFSVDHSQVRTRIYGKGYGQNLTADVNQYETILPVPDASVFNAAGGRAIAAIAPDTRTTEQLTYSGISLGIGGSLVGPGAAPSTAPITARAAGTGLGLGTYKYAYTWVTAAGESLPSPLATIATKVIPTPAQPSDQGILGVVGGSVSYFNDGFIGSIGDSVEYKVTYSYATSESDLTQESAASSALASTLQQAPQITGVPADGVAVPIIRIPYSTDAAITWIRFWWKNITRGDSSFTQLALVVDSNNVSIPGRLNNSIPNVVGTGTIDVLRDRTQGATTIPAGNANQKQMTITGVALGPSGTLSRKVYRTAVDGSQLKLHSTIADNTTTAPAVDSTADGSLGANAPVSDTSGLAQPTGQVNAGSATLLLASAGPFVSSGGWALGPAGSAIRYTAISGNTLTGIPATGPGSIETTLLYGTQITPAPCLTGVNAAVSPIGIQKAMLKGSAVHIWVQRDDLDAQAALGALQLKENSSPTDGIREDTITDERRNEESLIALCDATLDKISRPIVSARGAVKDPKFRVGRTVSIDITIGIYDPDFYDPSFYQGARRGTSGDFTIQTMDLEYDAPDLLPTRRFFASSVAFTLSDLLRVAALR